MFRFITHCKQTVNTFKHNEIFRFGKIARCLTANSYSYFFIMEMLVSYIDCQRRANIFIRFCEYVAILLKT